MCLAVTSTGMRRLAARHKHSLSFHRVSTAIDVQALRLPEISRVSSHPMRIVVNAIRIDINILFRRRAAAVVAKQRSRLPALNQIVCIGTGAFPNASSALEHPSETIVLGDTRGCTTLVLPGHHCSSASVVARLVSSPIKWYTYCLSTARLYPFYRHHAARPTR